MKKKNLTQEGWDKGTKMSNIFQNTVWHHALSYSLPGLDRNAFGILMIASIEPSLLVVIDVGT